MLAEVSVVHTFQEHATVIARHSLIRFSSCGLGLYLHSFLGNCSAILPPSQPPRVLSHHHKETQLTGLPHFRLSTTLLLTTTTGASAPVSMQRAWATHSAHLAPHFCSTSQTESPWGRATWQRPCLCCSSTMLQTTTTTPVTRPRVAEQQAYRRSPCIPG